VSNAQDVRSNPINTSTPSSRPISSRIAGRPAKESVGKYPYRRAVARKLHAFCCALGPCAYVLHGSLQGCAGLCRAVQGSVGLCWQLDPGNDMTRRKSTRRELVSTDQRAKAELKVGMRRSRSVHLRRKHVASPRTAAQCNCILHARAERLSVGVPLLLVSRNG
jgi:hypothetical protein